MLYCLTSLILLNNKLHFNVTQNKVQMSFNKNLQI